MARKCLLGEVVKASGELIRRPPFPIQRILTMQHHAFLLGAAALLIPGAAATPALAQDTSVSVRPAPQSAGTMATAVVRGHPFHPFVLVGDTQWAPGRYAVLGSGHLDATGRATVQLELPATFVREGAQLSVRAVSSGLDGRRNTSEAAGLTCSAITFERFGADHHISSTSVQAGEVIAEQWADVGLHVHAVNAIGGPDMAIAFDSSAPTGGDDDLMTPGPGPGNDFAFGNVMIIAENSVDGNGDGLIDDPDDDINGGILYYDWDAPVMLSCATLLDVDFTDAAGATCRTYFEGVLQESVFVPPMADNNVQVVPFNSDLRVDQLQVDFSGSGAVAQVSFLPCPIVLGFDHSTTGIPFGREIGEIVENQWLSQGVTISGVTNNAGDPDAVLLFDSANPTGGDDDLMTPGTGIGNTVAQGQILVLASDVVDMNGDGLVDDPGDSNGGGTFTVEFSYEVTLESATVIDIDSAEPDCFFEAFDFNGVSLGQFPLAQLGDNSSQTIDFDRLPGVRRLELTVCASGGLAEIVYCPTPDVGV